MGRRPVAIGNQSLLKVPRTSDRRFWLRDCTIAEALKERHTVHSFDHIAINDSGVTCDIAEGVPLPDESLDLAIFSLSLMGPNWKDQLVEARRCLKPTGQILIWTASSNKDAAEFSEVVENTGLKVVTTQLNYKWHHVWAVCV